MSTRFRYEARSAAGRLERGALEATSQSEALARLRQRNLTPLSLKVSSDGAHAAARLNKIAARDLARTLAQLLTAGLSFSQALKFAGEELTGPAAAAAARMHEAASAGEPASAALAQFDGAEARLLRGIIGAGEASGRLTDALQVAANAFERAAQLEGRIATALIYPSFVIAATLATLACFLLVVVPSLGQAFVGSEDRLPDSTRTLLALSTWLSENGLIALLAIAAIGGLLASTPPARQALAHAIDQILVSPLGLGVARRLDFSAFASLSALSLQAGVPGATAFEAAAASVRSASVRAALNRALAEIRVGERPSQAFARWSNPPRSFARLVHVGEETGRLGDTLAQASVLLNAEAEQRLERLGAIAGPLVTLGLGALVAGIVMSLFLGLLAMSELATA